ncbi:MAG: enoyl-CoA hydratase-related protein, partial [Nitrospiraceae bacterium]
MAYRFVSVAMAERIATVTLNNPPSNVLGTAVLQELDEIFSDLEANDTVRVVILTAGGRYFCPGADIKELAQVGTAHQGS